MIMINEKIILPKKNFIAENFPLNSITVILSLTIETIIVLQYTILFLFYKFCIYYTYECTYASIVTKVYRPNVYLLHLLLYNILVNIYLSGYGGCESIVEGEKSSRFHDLNGHTNKAFADLLLGLEMNLIRYAQRRVQV